MFDNPKIKYYVKLLCIDVPLCVRKRNIMDIDTLKGIKSKYYILRSFYTLLIFTQYMVKLNICMLDLFIYLCFNITFNTVEVISRRVVFLTEKLVHTVGQDSVL